MKIVNIVNIVNKCGSSKVITPAEVRRSSAQTVTDGQMARRRLVVHYWWILVNTTHISAP